MTKALKKAWKTETSWRRPKIMPDPLDDQPANIANPKKVAEWAKTLAKEEGLGIEIFDRAKMKKMNMNALLAVAQGSAEEPLLIKLEYNKGKNLPLYCVVGKGVTFDSGGISIKPAQNMHEMKYDKTGAMNVLGVFKAVSRRKLPIRLDRTHASCREYAFRIRPETWGYSESVQRQDHRGAQHGRRRKIDPR